MTTVARPFRLVKFKPRGGDESLSGKLARLRTMAFTSDHAADCLLTIEEVVDQLISAVDEFAAAKPHKVKGGAA